MLIIFKNIKENNDNQDIVFLLKVIKKQCTFIKEYKENYFYDAELSKFLIEMYSWLAQLSSDAKGPWASG